MEWRGQGGSAFHAQGYIWLRKTTVDRCVLACGSCISSVPMYGALARRISSGLPIISGS